MRFFFLSVFVFVTRIVLAQNVQVDPYTGSLHASIPLGTVSSGDIQVQIGLSYHTNGVKVTAPASDAGMDWSLIAGGRVTRVVRGLPDDIDESALGTYGRTGWLYGTNAQSIHNFTPTANLLDCNGVDYAFLDNVKYLKDTEPDLFSFSAPGLSGSFVYDKDLNRVPLPYQDLKIVVTRGATNLIESIEITDNQGIKYTFQKGLKVTRKSSLTFGENTPLQFLSEYNYYLKPVTFYESWDLTSITSPSGGSVTLTYSSTVRKRDSNKKFRAIGSSGNITDYYTTREDREDYPLQQITGRNSVATFAWDGGQINSITLTESSYNQSRKFNFKYKIAHCSDYNLADPEYHNVRPFLVDLSEEINCMRYPGYQFEYSGVSGAGSIASTEIPFDTDFKQDHFGYFNGSATSLATELYTNTVEGSNGERFRFEPASGYTLTASGGGRTVNATKVYSGTMSKITIPSGGVYDITFESNSYYDQTAAASINGGGVRVKTLKKGVNDPSSDFTETYTYTDATGQSSGRWLYRPMFAVPSGSSVMRFLENEAPVENIVYSRVTVAVTDRGKTVYDYFSPATYPLTSDTPDYTASVSRFTRSGGVCVGTDSRLTGYYSYPFAPNISFDFERGLESMITEYDETPKIVRKRIYTYERTTAPITTVYGLRFEEAAVGFVYSKYSILSNVKKRLKTEVSQVYDMNDVTNSKYIETTTTYTYNGNQMLREVATTNSDGVVKSNKFKYAKDYLATGTDQQSLMIASLNATNRHATLIEATTQVGSNYTGASLTMFNNTFGGSRVLPSEIRVLGDPTGFVESTIASNAFVSSNKYITTKQVDKYDDVGTAMIARDTRRTPRSVILGHKSTFPALDISNARTDEVVFADFEPNTSPSATYPAATNNTDVWAGRYSLNLNTGSSVTMSNVVRGQGRYYRFSCWVKGTSITNLNVQINGGTSTAVPYNQAGSWQFVDKRIDMNAITGAFSFALSATANVVIDNVVFYPEVANYTIYAHEPLFGRTAILDNRGVGQFTEYDVLGRPYRIRDQDKNLVKITDYHFMREVSIPTARITGSSSPLMGTATTYSIDLGCLTGSSYQWYVDGTAIGTASTLTYTFTENRDYVIKIAVNSNYGSVEDELVINPTPYFDVTKAQSGNTAISCFDGVRTVTYTLAGCYDTSLLTFEWHVVTGGVDSNVATDSGIAGRSRTFDLNTATSNVNIYAIIKTQCPVPGTSNADPIKFTAPAATYMRAAHIDGCDN